MPRPSLHLLLLALAFLVAVAHADDKARENQTRGLKRFVGAWKSEGELKSQKTGDILKITEEWTGKLGDDGELVIEGTRALNAAAPDPFRWNMNFNPSTELLEAVHLNPNDPAGAMRFEGNGTLDPPVLELRSGDSIIRFTFKGDALDQIHTEVTLCNEAGEPDLVGTVDHKKGN